MKRTLTAIALLLAAGMSLSAQTLKERFGSLSDIRRRTPEVAYMSPEMIGERQSWLMPNQSVSATIVGLEYGYEYPLGEIVSLIGRVGFQPSTLNFNYSHRLSECDFNFTSMAGVTLEPRVYTSFYKRARQGRNIYMNSGDFISFRFSAAVGFDGVGDVSLTPVYGIRRVFMAHWFHEFTVGPSFGYLAKELYCSPYIQYRLGFLF